MLHADRCLPALLLCALLACQEADTAPAGAAQEPGRADDDPGGVLRRGMIVLLFEPAAAIEDIDALLAKHGLALDASNRTRLTKKMPARIPILLGPTPTMAPADFEQQYQRLKASPEIHKLSRWNPYSFVKRAKPVAGIPFSTATLHDQALGLSADQLEEKLRSHADVSTMPAALLDSPRLSQFRRGSKDASKTRVILYGDYREQLRQLARLPDAEPELIEDVAWIGSPSHIVKPEHSEACIMLVFRAGLEPAKIFDFLKRHAWMKTPFSREQVVVMTGTALPLAMITVPPGKELELTRALEASPLVKSAARDAWLGPNTGAQQK